MLDVITIGDGMVTMNPKTRGQMRFVNEFERKIGGAELNFAIGCARLGLRTGWISRLGKDEFGRHIYNTVRGEGVDMSQVRLVEGYATSLNFKEIMEDGSGRTFYYRKDSPTLTMTPDQLEEQFFEQSRLLHITGVFPSIHEQNIILIEKAVSIAKQYGLKISFDPNIRLKMWSKERAKEVLTSFLPHVDIILAGEDEAKLLLDAETPSDMIAKFREYGIQYIAIKKGERGSIGADGNQVIEALPVSASKVIDTVGAGDGYDAGFIYGVLCGWKLERILKFANTIGSMVVGVMGDNEGLPYYEDVMAHMGELERVDR